MIIKVDQLVLDRCTEFADKRIKQSYDLYRSRGPSKIEKIKNDIMVGSVCEFAAAEFLKLYNTSVTEPDLNIYDVKKKSFACDIKTESMDIHVKSTTKEASEKFGTSWLFQKSDPLFKRPSDRDHLVLCVSDVPEVEIIAVVNVKTLLESKILREPFYEAFRETKYALYLEDLEKLASMS